MRKSPFNTSTGTKILIALTGLLLIAFLIFHLAGNLLVFAGPDTFNRYASTLGGLSVLVVGMEIGLALIFLLHIFKAVTNFQANRQARPVAYHKKEWAGDPSRKTLSSSTMIVTGIIVLLFVILHLRLF